MSRLRRTVVSCVASCFFVLSLSAVFAAGNPHKNLSQYAELGYVPDEVLVQFNPHARLSEKALLNRSMRATEARKSEWGGFSVMRLPKGTDVFQTSQRYMKNKNVEWAAPNLICKAFFTPNDPDYPKQWNFDNLDTGGIHMPAAWDVTTGDPSVVVAVIDTGIAYENYDEDKDGLYDYLLAPDLAGTAFVEGYDFINGDRHANDDEGHGTHVTGTIAQTTNNGLGVAGIAPNVTIMPVKVLGEYGFGTLEAVVNGIYFVAYKGVNVANMSLGWDPVSVEILYDYIVPPLRKACRYAHSRGVTLVASAGNESYNYIGMPAGIDEAVIAVGATDYANDLTWYSNFGLSVDSLVLWNWSWIEGIDIVAPGGDTGADLNSDGNPDGVLQQTIGELFFGLTGDPLTFRYAYFQGTSMASPHVAGVAALICSLGVTDPDAVRQVLQLTALDLGDVGYDQIYGWGLLDAEAAVVLAAGLGDVSGGPTANAGPDRTVTDSDSNGLEEVLLDGSASTSGIGFPIATYQWYREGFYLGEGITLNVRLAVGTHVIALKCTDTDGASDTDTVTITVNPGPPAMRVSRIDVEGRPYKGMYDLKARVFVLDTSGNPVYRARVAGSWSGDLNRIMRPVYTDRTGQAVFSAGRVGPGTYTFTVTSVNRSGYTYRSDLNGETSDTGTLY